MASSLGRFKLELLPVESSGSPEHKKSTQNHKHSRPSAGPEVIKLIPYSTQQSIKFIKLINVKMQTIIGILTFISMINTTSERLLYYTRLFL